MPSWRMEGKNLQEDGKKICAVVHISVAYSQCFQLIQYHLLYYTLPHPCVCVSSLNQVLF